MIEFAKRRIGWAIVTVAAGAIVLGCSGDEAGREPVVVRDSAGIRIVESSAPLLPQGSWTIAAEASVEIGANDRDSMQILHQVEGVTRLSDGRIVIAHGVAPALRWYDSTGAFVHGTGRFGQGPGEFDGGEGGIWIYALWPLPGDSVATWEHSRRRMQVYDPQGRYVRALTVELPPGMPERSYPQIAGRIDGGFIFFLHEEREPGPLGSIRHDSAQLMRYDAGGKYVRSIARVPTFVSTFREFRTRQGTVYHGEARVPFSPTWSFAAGDDRFFQGGRLRYEVTVLDSTGATRMLIRHVEPLRPVTTAIRDDYRQRMIAAAGNDPARLREAEASLDATFYPDSLPGYRQMRVDREGMLWVLRYEPTGATVGTWSVHDREGRWVTDVTIPTKLSIQEIGRDYILVLEPDDMDVERVRLYRLRRGG